MKAITQLLLLLTLTLSITATAQTTPAANELDTDQLLQHYLDTWSTTDPDARLAKLNALWVEDGFHKNPFGHSQGIKAIDQEIAGFLTNYPGAVARFDNIKRTGNHIVCTFTVVNAEGDIIFSGVDYVEISDTGRIVKVIGFM